MEIGVVPEIKNKRINSAIAAFEQLRAARGADLAAKMKFARLRRALLEQHDLVEEVRIELLEEHAEEGGDGNLKMQEQEDPETGEMEETGRVELGANREAFESAYSDLMEATFVVDEVILASEIPEDAPQGVFYGLFDLIEDGLGGEA